MHTIPESRILILSLSATEPNTCFLNFVAEPNTLTLSLLDALLQ